MSTLRNPVGPQPPAVYWRRRQLVLLGLVAVIVVVILIVARPGSGSGTPGTNPSDSPSPSGSASADPDEGTDADAATACDASDVQIEPITDAESYPDGVEPLISMTITNTSADACTFDVGTAAQGYLIKSGSDRIWSSKDCQTGATADPRVLEPNVPQQTTPFPWDRTRSSKDTCDGDRPEVIAGGATYRLSVTLGDAVSDPEDKPFILK